MQGNFTKQSEVNFTKINRRSISQNQPEVNFINSRLLGLAFLFYTGTYQNTITYKDHWDPGLFHMFSHYFNNRQMVLYILTG